jgi:methionyl-tRNA formyltransferase
MLSIVFFGSFQQYSVIVLQRILASHGVLSVRCVVTTPPKPAGREMTLQPTAVELFARDQGLPVYGFPELDLKSLELLKLHKSERPDFFVSAGYGKLIPPEWLAWPKIAPVNLHFSYLPDYPGRFPAEWAILAGEKQTGITLIVMSPEFDKGAIITQERVAITATDTREILYDKLYNAGADLVVRVLPVYATGKLPAAIQQRPVPPKYARQLHREDGYLPPALVRMALRGQILDLTTAESDPTSLMKEIAEYKKSTTIPMADFVQRMIRAFHGWPGVWTTSSTIGFTGAAQKRVKLLDGHIADNRLVLDTIQVEGKLPISGKDAAAFAHALQKTSDQ